MLVMLAAMMEPLNPNNQVHFKVCSQTNWWPRLLVKKSSRCQHLGLLPWESSSKRALRTGEGGTLCRKTLPRSLKQNVLKWRLDFDCTITELWTAYILNTVRWIELKDYTNTWSVSDSWLFKASRICHAVSWCQNVISHVLSNVSFMHW